MARTCCARSRITLPSPQETPRITGSIPATDMSIRQHESTSPNEAAEFFRVLREMQSGDATNGQTWDGVSGLARHRDELALVDHGLAGIDGIAQLLHAHLCTEAAGSSALGDHLADRLFYGLRALTTCSRAALARTFDVAGEQP